MTREEKAARNAIIAERRRANVSMNDIAAEFGLTQGAVSSICRSLGLGGKRSTKVATYHPRTLTKEKLDAEEERRRKVVADRCKGFSYVGNYTGNEGTADIQCNTCGAILTRSWITIKHAGGRHTNVRCDNCERLKRKANFKPLRKPPQGVQLSLNVSAKQCEECGTMFVSKMGNEKYCSKCRKRVVNRNKDKRINRANIVDRDISLNKLYKRDNGICYICGVRCDFEDHHTEDGNFIVGPTYPTIEHVFPLSRGGLHSWDNVRLACHACNSKKWAHLPEQIE